MVGSVKLISVTDMCAYNLCRRSLYLKLVLGFREPAKPVMVLGSIRHRVYEEANRKEEELVSQIGSDMKRQEILQMFSNAYNAVLNKSVCSYLPQLESLSMDKEAVTVQLQQAVAGQAAERAGEIVGFSSRTGLFGRELWEKLTPKILSELPVRSEKLRLKGIVDRIEVHGSEYVPVEIKTGRAPSEGVWPDHRLQVAAYMLLLNEKFRTNIKEGLVNYVAAGQSRQVVMNPFMEYEIAGAVNNVFGLVEQKKVPDFCGKGYCGVCSLGDEYEKRLVRQAPASYAHPAALTGTQN